MIVINDFLVGGAQRMMAELCSRIDRERFDIELVTLCQFKEQSTMYHLVPNDVPVHKLNFRGFWDMAQWLALWRLLHIKNPDVVLSNLFFSNTVTRIIGLVRSYRVIVVEHNTYIAKTYLQILFDRILALRTAAIVAVSQNVLDFTVRQEDISATKFVRIENGVAIEEIAKIVSSTDRNLVRKELGIAADAPVIISVGRLVTQKNPELLVSGFAHFARTHPLHHLVLLGDGPLRLKIQTLIREKGIASRVHILGSRADVYRYYAISEFFVSTSSIEGLSMAHIEALASGVPLLATRTAGSEEVIREGVNGFFIEKADTESVADRMETMAQMDVGKIKEGARESARQYDISVTVKKYESLLRPNDK